MSISKKIVEEIKNLNDVDNEFKNLMLDILEKEDEGIYKYLEEYEKLVSSYLNSDKTRS